MFTGNGNPRQRDVDHADLRHWDVDHRDLDHQVINMNQSCALSTSQWTSSSTLADPRLYAHAQGTVGQQLDKWQYIDYLPPIDHTRRNQRPANRQKGHSRKKHRKPHGVDLFGQKKNYR